MHGKSQRKVKSIDGRKMKMTTTDKLPDLNIAGLNKILQIKPDVSDETLKAKHDAR